MKKCECETSKITKQDTKEIFQDEQLSIVVENNNDDDIPEFDNRNNQLRIKNVTSTDKKSNSYSISDNTSNNNEGNVFILI